MKYIINRTGNINIKLWNSKMFKFNYIGKFLGFYIISYKRNSLGLYKEALGRLEQKYPGILYCWDNQPSKQQLIIKEDICIVNYSNGQ